MLQQPSNFLTDKYYNPQKLRLTKIKISEIFTAIFHNMKKLLQNTFFRGGGGQFPRGEIFWGAIFLGALFPRGTFPGGIFPGGIFSRGIFPSTNFFNYRKIWFHVNGVNNFFIILCLVMLIYIFCIIFLKPSIRF